MLELLTGRENKEVKGFYISEFDLGYTCMYTNTLHIHNKYTKILWSQYLEASLSDLVIEFPCS